MLGLQVPLHVPWDPRPEVAMVALQSMYLQGFVVLPIVPLQLVGFDCGVIAAGNRAEPFVVGASKCKAGSDRGVLERDLESRETSSLPLVVQR